MSIYVPGAGISIPDTDYTTPSGPYEGVILKKIPDGLFRFGNPAICYVSGSGPNTFGHALFMISVSIGYVHSVQPGTHPVRFLPHDQYDDYLETMGKVSWKMLHVDLPSEVAAANYIRGCLTEGYNWQPWHNCLTFCDAILKASGSKTHPSSCVFPSTATQQPGAITQPGFKHPWDAIGDDDL